MHDPYPFLVTVPHGGLLVPGEIADMLALGPADLARLSDPATGLLYDFGGRVAARLEARISRVAVDVNRPPYHLPPLHPDGAIKSRTPDRRAVYRGGGFPPIEVVHGLMLRHYFPFHEAVDRLLDENGVRCAFDCHSMEPFGPPLAKDAGRRRPLVCLGNHGDANGEPRRGRLATCPPRWMRILATHFQAAFPEGEVAVNRPFPGGFTSMAHYWHRGIPWVQIELNRGLYESPDGAVDGEAVAELRERCRSVLAAFWEDTGSGEPGRTA
ncbi:MAG: N-formylglutamate amidohydrolase [Methanospirillum sp.]|nr:N-formylglutamate amidohydrolase [Methanospirillum sp.]